MAATPSGDGMPRLRLPPHWQLRLPTANCSCEQQVHGPPAQLRNCNEGLVAPDNKTGQVTYEKIITCTLDMV